MHFRVEATEQRAAQPGKKTPEFIDEWAQSPGALRIDETNALADQDKSAQLTVGAQRHVYVIQVCRS